MKAINWKEIPATVPMAGLSKRVAIGPEIGAFNFVMRIFEMQPGITSPHHSHSWEHEIYVIDGCGTALNHDGEKTTIQKGDVIFIPPQEMHSLANTGTAALQFICLVPADGDK
ncbi:MAG: cupin domain-containing protein [Proteobacteria bacterium]|nr:cupin domain-containing protein [Pseudomonadota bacterium]MBU1712865.1 cupin domain-containing protein [Pseudomonadota bacterium]